MKISAGRLKTLQKVFQGLDVDPKVPDKGLKKEVVHGGFEIETHVERAYKRCDNSAILVFAFSAGRVSSQRASVLCGSRWMTLPKKLQALDLVYGALEPLPSYAVKTIYLHDERASTTG